MGETFDVAYFVLEINIFQLVQFEFVLLLLLLILMLVLVFLGDSADYGVGYFLVHCVHEIVGL